MAKRNPNDRNAVALIKAQRAAQPGTWTSKDGRVIKLKKAEIMFIQMASSSVDVPEPPTYTVKVGQHEREYPLDELVIEQTEDEVERSKLRRRWLNYQQDLGSAYSEIAKRATGAVIFEGTVPDEEMLENDTNWHKRMKVTGWRIPTDPEERWVLYLQTSLSEDELGKLSEAVMRYAGGASEELVGAAVKSFSDNPQTDSRSGDVADTGSDSEGD